MSQSRTLVKRSERYELTYPHNLYFVILQRWFWHWITDEVAQSAGAEEKTDCISAEGKDSPNEYPRHEVHTISFQTFFVWVLKIVVDPWKFTMLLLYILWDDWPIFLISGSNEHLEQKFEYTLLKPDCFKCAIWYFSRTICNKILF